MAKSSINVLLLLGSVLLAGCSKEPAQFVETSKYSPGILLSELYAKSVNERFVKEVFRLENDTKSDQTLVLKKKSCSCVDVYFDDKLISRGEPIAFSPGGSETLRIKSSLPTVPAQHDFSVFIDVFQKGELQGQRYFHLVVPIYANVALQPNVLCQDFSAATKNTQKDIIVTRTVRDKKLLLSEYPKVGGLPPTVEVISISKPATPKELEPGIWQSSWTIGLSIKADEKLTGTAQPQTARVAFEGRNNYKENTADFSIILRRKFGIDVSKEIAFGAIVSGQTRTRRLLMRAADDHEFEILETESSSPLLKANTPSHNAKKHWIDLEFQAEKIGKFQEKLVVYTNHPDSPKIEIQVEGLVVNPTDTASSPTKLSK